MSEVRCTELAFQLYGAQERIAELKAENERLREAVHKAHNVVTQEKVWDCSWCGEVAYILQQALEGQEP